MFELIFGWGWIVPIFILPLLFWDWDTFGGIYICWIIFGITLLFGFFEFEIYQLSQNILRLLTSLMWISVIIFAWLASFKK